MAEIGRIGISSRLPTAGRRACRWNVRRPGDGLARRSNRRGRAVFVDGDPGTAAKVLDKYAERTAVKEIGKTRSDAENQKFQAIATGLMAGGVGCVTILVGLCDPESAWVLVLTATPLLLVAASGFYAASGIVEEWEAAVAKVKARILENGTKKDGEDERRETSTPNLLEAPNDSTRR